MFVNCSVSLVERRVQLEEVPGKLQRELSRTVAYKKHSVEGEIHGVRSGAQLH